MEKTFTVTALHRAPFAEKLLSIATIALLTITLFALGLCACAALPTTTRILSESQSAEHISPYAKSELVSLALETRAFTVEDFGRGAFGAREAEGRLARDILEAAKEALGDDEKANLWTMRARAILASIPDAASLDSQDAMAKMLELSEASQAYALDADAIAHLNDVNGLLAKLAAILGIIGILGVGALAVVGMAFGRREAGRIVLASGVATIAVILLLAGWALVSFDSLFACMHALFFAAGSWTFPYDSLLICMYPEGFWMGMAIVWGLVSALASAICICAGSWLRMGAAKGDAHQGQAFSSTNHLGPS